LKIKNGRRTPIELPNKKKLVKMAQLFIKLYNRNNIKKKLKTYKKFVKRFKKRIKRFKFLENNPNISRPYINIYERPRYKRTWDRKLRHIYKLTKSVFKNPNKQNYWNKKIRKKYSIKYPLKNFFKTYYDEGKIFP
jgi:hypothetical protein